VRTPAGQLGLWFYNGQPQRMTTATAILRAPTRARRKLVALRASIPHNLRML